jgi:hypothetical protein
MLKFSEIQKSSAKVLILNILIIQQTLAKSIQGLHVSLWPSYLYFKISEISCDYKLCLFPHQDIWIPMLVFVQNFIKLCKIKIKREYNNVATFLLETSTNSPCLHPVFGPPFIP